MINALTVGFYGESNSGKTTLIEGIIKDLSKEGFKIASIKITDKEISIDKEGKDTNRFMKAGSNLVVLSSKLETDFMINYQLKTSDIIGKIEIIDSFDLILVEGANDEVIPKIRVGKGRTTRKNTIFTYDENYDKLINFIKNMLNNR